MRRIRIGGALVVGLVMLTACGDSDRHCPASPGAVDAFVADTMPKGSSGTVMAARGDRIVYCQGFGMADRAAGIHAGCDTVYDVSQ